MSTKVLIWSCDYSIENGQNIVTRRVTDKILPAGIQKKFIYKAGWKGIFGVLILWIKSLFYIRQCKHIYCVISRSPLGFIRDLPILFLAFHTKKNLICHSHGSDLPILLKTKFIGSLAERLFKYSTLVVPSRHTQCEIRDLGFDQVVLIENFFESPDALMDKDEKCIIWNSNLLASKGILEFLDLAKFSKSRKLGYQFRIFGLPVSDATMSADTVMQRVMGSVEDRCVTYEGAVPLDEMLNRCMQAEAIFLFSNYKSECQPLAVIQAMCFGCKLIVSDTLAMRTTVGAYPCNFCSSPDQLRQSLLKLSEQTIQLTDIQAAKTRFSSAKFDERISSLFALN